MAGSKEGARKAVATKLVKYGKDFYKETGRKGGKARNKSSKKYTPFTDREFASKMGKKAAKARWQQRELKEELSSVE